MSSAGVLSCWHRSDCLIRSHSCTVPESLSPSLPLSFAPDFISLPSLFALPHAPPASPSFSGSLIAFGHHLTLSRLLFRFNSWWPTLLLLPSLFLYLSQPVGCVIVQWRQTDRLTAEVKGTGWGSTLQVLAHLSPVEAEGWLRPILVAPTIVLSPSFQSRPAIFEK